MMLYLDNAPKRAICLASLLGALIFATNVWADPGVTDPDPCPANTKPKAKPATAKPPTAQPPPGGSSTFAAGCGAEVNGAGSIAIGDAARVSGTSPKKDYKLSTTKFKVTKQALEIKAHRFSNLGSPNVDYVFRDLDVNRALGAKGIMTPQGNVATVADLPAMGLTREQYKDILDWLKDSRNNAKDIKKSHYDIALGNLNKIDIGAAVDTDGEIISIQSVAVPVINAVAIGSKAVVQGDGGVALGAEAKVVGGIVRDTAGDPVLDEDGKIQHRGTNGIAIGSKAVVEGVGGVALGADAVVGGIVRDTAGNPVLDEDGKIQHRGTNGIAIGNGAKVNGDNGIAIGAGVTAADDNEIVIGTSAHSAMIAGVDIKEARDDITTNVTNIATNVTNIAANTARITTNEGGIAANASAIADFNDRLLGVDERVKQVAAMSAALSAVPNAVSGDGDFFLGVGFGNSGGEQGIAVGVSARFGAKKNIVINAGAASAGDETSVRAGVGFVW